MLKAGIYIDAWKLPIFERRLKKAGYTWDTNPGLSPNTLSMMVMTNSIKELEAVVRAANTEAAESKGART